MKNPILFYDSLFTACFKSRIEKDDIPLKHIHSLNVAVIITGILMWAYAFIAYFTIGHTLPAKIGFITSVVHLLTPLLFRWSRNHFLITSIMLGAGVIHQGTFAYFTGGYSSELLIWYGIIPMLAGIISGRRACLFWAINVTIISITFLIFQINGHIFPNLISKTGLLISHSLLIFGWILTATVTIFIFNTLIDINEQKLEEKNQKIDSLLKILLHDMSNSIHVCRGTISILLKQINNPDSEKQERRFNTIKKHTDYLSDTVSSIKSMYVIDSNLKEIGLEPLCLNSSLEMVISLLEHKIEAKGIIININYHSEDKLKVWGSPHIFENQILQNIFTNAIKFSHPNGIIDIDIQPDSRNEKLLVITIKDHGIGMPKILLDNIFNPQYKTSRKGTSDEIGTGFGMHIIRNFVDKMGGSMTIDSEESKGTQITLQMQKA